MELTSDPLVVLLRHDRWATARVIEGCAGVNAEEWRRGFDMGLGTLEATLTHMVAAQRRWADRIAERELRPMLEVPAGGLTAAEVAELHAEAADDLERVAAAAREQGLERQVTVRFGRVDYVFTKGVALVHAATHGMHHRAQCLNMLRRLGRTELEGNLPHVGAVDWQAEVETGQLARWKPRTAE